MVKIKPEEIPIMSRYIYDLSGIVLDHKKAYLMESRFSSLLNNLGLNSYVDLYNYSRKDSTRQVETRIIDAITTNETLFFRDSSPFEMLQHKILPDLIDRRSSKSSSFFTPRLRIWSAACSTGQEVYSMAMVLHELLAEIGKYDISILGTDLSDAALAQASYGSYNKFEIDRGMARNRLEKYFDQVGESWHVKDFVRGLASFRKLNLMEPFDHLGKFDIVFCRNVAIYFSMDDRKRLFDRIADVMQPDGVLVIGSTESLTGISARFEPQRHLRSIYYQLKG